ncbi:MAG: helix-turn-helix domain-containing protein [Candidatus Aenigmarchaeota archaeon]|nr:helix-turn-helix domain-containing protein [Candidatus Aenigmarchaeota archaeon]MDI6722884.1 helix-turn-helix domain-containing protein [Candidatus Aenigmarchaeota archaeon]
MPKKKLSDIVFQRVSPPDGKMDLTTEDLADVLVRRLGLKRKESRAKHAKLLLELIKYKKDNIPLSVEQISKILGVSQSQTYEELRKWRTLGLVEFIKVPVGAGYIKGYMITSNTVNRLLDRAESSAKSFFRKTRRIAKDFDDLLMLEMARLQREDKSEGKMEDMQEQQEEKDKITR